MRACLDALLVLPSEGTQLFVQQYILEVFSCIPSYSDLSSSCSSAVVFPLLT